MNTIESKASLATMLGRSSPFKWDLERWAAIGGVTGCVLFVLTIPVSLISLSVPPPIMLLVLAILCFVLGVLIPMLIVSAAWILVGSLRWLAQRLT